MLETVFNNIFKKTFLFVMLGFVFLNVMGQINIDKLEKLNVDLLSDSQIKEFRNQYVDSGHSLDDIEDYCSQRGMSQYQIDKLKDRIQKLEKKEERTGENKSASKIDAQSTAAEVLKERISNTDQTTTNKANQIFGADMFSNSKMTFAPNQNMPTPRNYVVGPGDELVIDVYGYSENTMRLSVSSEGNVRIPNVGPVSVNGLTIEAVEQKIKRSLSQIYSSINSGHTQVTVTIGNVKSISVYITGSVVNPGTYTLSSLSTVYNALYACSGPSSSGSLRNIKVVRGGNEIAVIDLYSFLVNGSLENNISLKDQDVIVVPSYDIRVSIEGAMKKPGIFEMKQGETLKDLIKYAGGFTENAYQNRITVQRTTDKERSVADVSSELFNMFHLQTGDQFIVAEILNRFTNRVQIYGSVFRPGLYALDEGMTLKDLVQKADGLLEDAYMERATITRLRDDLTPELISFNVKDLIDGNFNILLKKEDEVTIGSIKELEEKKTVSIYGQVLSPGVFTFYENMTVNDLIFLAKGFKEFADVERIELSRKVKDDKKLKEDIDKMEVRTISINRDLTSGGDGDIKLEPNDQVSVRLKEGIETNKAMSVIGEIRQPGDYVIINKKERISDILARAGGLTSYAYAKGAFLIRRTDRSVSETMRDQKIIEKLAEDGGNREEVMQELRTRTDLVGIDLESIIRHPGSDEDIFVENADLVFIPKKLQTITVSGNVNIPGMIVFRSKSCRKMIRYSGGFRNDAYKRGTYVAYANGSIKGTRKFLWFKNYPKVEPGSHIYVPEKSVTTEDRRARASFATSITSAVVTTASVACTSIVTIRSFKK